MLKLNLFLVLCLFIFGSKTSQGQMEINTKTSKKEKKKKNEDNDFESSTSVYLIANWSHTTRKLIENDGLFGDSLGDRAQETGIGTWSYGIGMINSLNDNLSWEGGILYAVNGEKNDIKTADTSYNYTTRYTYIGMPLKLHFTYGEKVKLIAGAGLVPQMFMNFKQERRWLEGGDPKSEDLKFTSGYSPFVLSAVFNLGVQARLTDRVGVILMPEYRMQLTSSYEKNDSYKHFGRALGVSGGITVEL